MTEVLRPSYSHASGRLRLRDGRVRLLRAGPGRVQDEHARRHRRDMSKRRVAAGVRRDIVSVLICKRANTEELVLPAG